MIEEENDKYKKPRAKTSQPRKKTLEKKTMSCDEIDKNFCI